MTTPTVIEIARPLEVIAHDTFADDLQRTVARAGGSGAAADAAPRAAGAGTVTRLRPSQRRAAIAFRCSTLLARAS